MAAPPHVAHALEMVSTRTRTLSVAAFLSVALSASGALADESQASSQPEAPARAAAQPEGPPRPTGETVHVRARSEIASGAWKLLLVGAGGGTRVLCDLPCEVDVAKDAHLRLDVGQKPLDVQLEEQRPRRVDLVARRSVDGGRVAGGVLLTLLGLAGVFIGGASLALRDLWGSRPTVGGDVARVATLVAGGAALVGAGFVFSSLERASVSVTRHRASGKASGAGPVREDAPRATTLAPPTQTVWSLGFSF